MKVYVTDLKGVEHPVEPILKWTLMEIIRDADLPIKAECGGSCACATCHVYVDPEWLAKLPAQEGEERDTLDGGFDVQPNSRLACQIVFTPELNGLKVTLSKDAAG
ncbi:MAG TPA: 2Fe-2S iron-sulfur cluster-binding protein [Alphaproteobacteria bacterium]|nr:2Fe-2S iron-sulfur cluster-binding protein [Alphaproteobacteria bacterium]